MKLKEVKLGKLKALSIYAITKEGQGIEFILTDEEKLMVVDLIDQLHGGVLKVVKRDNLESRSNYDI